MENQHLEEDHEDPGEDASVVGDDRDIVEAQANVGQQSYREHEYDRDDQLVVNVVQTPRQHGLVRIERPQADVSARRANAALGCSSRRRSHERIVIS